MEHLRDHRQGPQRHPVGQWRCHDRMEGLPGQERPRRPGGGRVRDRVQERDGQAVIFRTTRLAGLFIIETEPLVDERGYFARTYCAREFAEKGLCTAWVQTSTSFNRQRGTLR